MEDTVVIGVAGNERKGLYLVARYKGGAFADRQCLTREAQEANAQSLAAQMGNPAAAIKFLPEAEALLVG